MENIPNNSEQLLGSENTSGVPRKSTSEEITKMTDQEIQGEILDQIKARPVEIVESGSNMSSIISLVNSDNDYVYVETYKRIINFSTISFDEIDKAQEEFSKWRKAQLELIKEAEQNNQPERAKAISVVGSIFSNIAQQELAQKSIEKQKADKE